MVNEVGLEPTIAGSEDRSLYQLGYSRSSQARALPVVPYAFDAQNATRTLAFTLAGFTLSSGFQELPLSSIAMPVALAFRDSGCATLRRVKHRLPLGIPSSQG